MTSALSPLRLGPFRFLLGARSVNEVGFWLGEVALAILVFDATGSALATAALFLSSQVVPALLGPGLVARIEPMDVRRALPLLYVAEATAFTALAIVADSFALLLVLVLTTFDGVFALAARALTRATAAHVLKPAGELRAGSALLNLPVTLGAAVGPGVAGLIIAGVGVQLALLVGAAALLLTAVTIAMARSLPQSPDFDREPVPWRTRLREGLAYVRHRRTVARLLAAESVLLVFFSAVLPIEVLYAKETLGAGDAGYGALLASWGAGMVVGGLFFAVARRTSLPRLLLLSTLLVGASYVGLAAAPTLLVACIASATGGMGNGVQWVSFTNAVQEMTEDRFQARVMGLLESLSAAMPGVGFVIGGVVAQLASPRAAYLVGGLGVLIVVAIAVPILRRLEWPLPAGLRPAPDAPVDARRPIEVGDAG